MPDGKPHILAIWDGDFGVSNLSCYRNGLLGCRRPSVDRIADEGMRFTDSYGEQSCDAGRAAFISGRSVYRTGIRRVRHFTSASAPKHRSDGRRTPRFSIR
jgi:arylsulfatase